MKDPIPTIEAMPENRWIQGDLVERTGQHVAYDVIGWLLHEAGMSWSRMERPALGQSIYNALGDEYGLTAATVGWLIHLNDGAKGAREAKERTVEYPRDGVLTPTANQQPA